MYLDIAIVWRSIRVHQMTSNRTALMILFVQALTCLALANCSRPVAFASVPFNLARDGGIRKIYLSADQASHPNRPTMVRERHMKKRKRGVRSSNSDCDHQALPGHRIINSPPDKSLGQGRTDSRTRCPSVNHRSLELPPGRSGGGPDGRGGPSPFTL